MGSKRGKRGAACQIGGLLLCAAALLLAGYNLLDERSAARRADEALAALSSQIPKVSAAPDGQLGEAALPRYVLDPEMQMPTVRIAGRDYVGILQIPSLQIVLPVISQCSDPNLKIAPCRYSGTAYTGHLVLAGHNYRTHFGPIRQLAIGARVEFRDAQGNCFSYEVVQTEVLNPSEVQALLCDAWDLSLFTCTYGGQARIVVRCRKILPNGMT